ncbi:VCBS repeat-containing protein [Nocardioides sp. ChNu-153]|uniref:FG-GAP-like repeat-containing protein n=1 Tax=unclassified Nocardioides TaxID=2615069 RepID=UPI0024066BD0|nr:MULTISPECIES: FG-GAP-like repeat-containing protein [unclassified Nocardioides]MDF9715645.1 VCBS repeat-containing protein [Nocardioides sp. ChNu-99]MDN7121629.1 VCBS repeat-containing protein [Nocardioides sp. ChNu-153]
MPPSKARFVTACQQLLALFAVLAVLAPAANTISLDVTHAPEAATLPVAAAADEAPVATAPVEPTVAEVPLTDAEGVAEEDTTTGASVEPPLAPAAPTTAAESTVAAEPAPATTEPAAEPVAVPATELTSEPQPVTGFGAVGVTWDPQVQVTGDDIDFRVRTATAGTWSAWEELPYEAEATDGADDTDAADATAEADARPGTELVFVGEVDEVQVDVVAPGGVPADLTVSVIDPGETTVVEEAPEYDGTTTADPTAATTASYDAGSATGATTATTTAASDTPDASAQGDLRLAAAASVPQPAIYSRAQWGADESMRDSAPRYAAVRGAVIHHTVNANDYTAAQVPGIIRGIYAYHTKSQGWADVGYNFLVDKFGRLWEGRYGGITKAVRGAHISAYNDYAFGISAIGNYETAQPSAAMVQAIANLLAWKLAIHGVDAASTNQSFGGDRFPAIIGHRDGGQTACPGKYLYAKIPGIRTEAKRIQNGASAPAPAPTPAPTPAPGSTVSKPAITGSNLIGNSYPDVPFRMSDGRVWLLPTGGLTSYTAPVKLTGSFTGAQGVALSPDLTGDGRADMVIVDRGGAAWIRPGTGGGGFATTKLASASMFRGTDNLTPVGDIDGDGRNDLLARFKATGETYVYLGNGRGGFTPTKVARDWRSYELITSVGDLTDDGKPDLVMRDTAGKLWIIPGGVAGTVKGRVVAMGARIQVPGDFGSISAMGGWGDVTADRKADLVVRLSSGTVYIMPGNGDARLGPARGPVATKGAYRSISGGGNVIGGSSPDLLTRVGDDVYLLPHSGKVDHTPAVATNVVVPAATQMFNVGDWDKDGRGDLVTRSSGGGLTLWRGTGTGTFAAGVPLGSGVEGVTSLRFVGDVTSDGMPDFFGRSAEGTLRIFPGNGVNGFKPGISASQRLADWYSYGGLDLRGYDLVTTVASLTGAGRPDLVIRHKSTGLLRLVQWDASGRVVTNRVLAQASSKVNLLG